MGGRRSPDPYRDSVAPGSVASVRHHAARWIGRLDDHPGRPAGAGSTSHLRRPEGAEGCIHRDHDLGVRNERIRPHRLKRILDAPGFDDQLADFTAAALTDGGVAAYRLVYDRRYNEDGAFFAGLGPAFGTKYLHFVTAAHARVVTPILDAVITRWFADHMPEVDLRVDGWTYPSRYEQYVSILGSWGEELGISADEVEHLIFAQQQSRSRSGVWSESWAVPGHTDPTAALAGLRDALDRHDLLPGLEPELDRIATVIEAAARRPRGAVAN